MDKTLFETLPQPAAGLHVQLFKCVSVCQILVEVEAGVGASIIMSCHRYFHKLGQRKDGL